MNEILMAASVFVFFGGLVAFFRIFGKNGIFAWTVICTIAANIEVLILVHAYGMDTTLGNVIFASSFLATDIMSEIYGKEEANKCVKIGIAANITFILISQSWFLYIPAEADTMATADVFFAQVDKYDDLPTDIPALAAFCAMNKTVDYAGRMVYDDKNEIIFNFGKYKGRPVKQVLMMDPSYYDWMMNSDFSLDTKRALTQVRLSMNARINQR